MSSPARPATLFESSPPAAWRAASIWSVTDDSSSCFAYESAAALMNWEKFIRERLAADLARLSVESGMEIVTFILKV